MVEPRIKSVQCISPAGLHEMSYKEWGDENNPNTLICVHGVTRVGDDFDNLARALCGHYRVVCPDVVGRGRSGKLANPELYRVPQYVSDMVALVARVSAVPNTSIDWFGTSMGGLIGMALASLPHNPIRKLVLNDIGPCLDATALQRIGDYIGQELKFPDFDKAATFVREVSLSFGEHSDDEWRKLASDVLREEPGGQWVRHYDMGLAQPFRSSTPETVKADERMLWAAYDAIRCPTLLVRGTNSDLLSHETAEEMTRRGPKASLVEIPNVGHAPTFLHEDQIAIAKQFLVGPADILKETMEITRLHVGKRLSEVAVYNDTVYLAGQIADDTSADIVGQTREVLAHVDRLLTEAGSDKTCILMCQIYISDMGNFAGMNEVWDEWIAQGHTPPRATVEAKLANPACLVEIVVTAGMR